MKDNLQQDQVEWNLSSGIVSEIQNLLNTANRLYINGNILKAFWCLKSVKFRFIQSLAPNERKALRKIEKSFYDEVLSDPKAFCQNVSIIDRGSFGVINENTNSVQFDIGETPAARES